jgi:hypothetical protein
VSLSKQIQQVLIHGGLTEEAHPFVAVAPGNSEVINGRFLAEGAIAKRHGSTYSEIVDWTPNLSAEGGSHTLTEHDGRLVVLTHDGALAQDEVKGFWTRLGEKGPRPSQTKTDPHIRGNNGIRQPDCATGTVTGADGITRTVCCTVWHDYEADECLYAWHELPSDGRPPVALYGPARFTAGAQGVQIERFPKVATSNGVWTIVGTDAAGTDCNGAQCTLASGYAFGTVARISSALANPNIGVVDIVGGPAGDNGFWIVFPLSSISFVIVRLSIAGGLTIQASQTTTGSGMPLAIGYVYDLATRRVAVPTSTGVVVHAVSTLAAATTAVAVITPTASIVHAATICQSSTGGGMLVCWSGSGDSNTDGGGLNNFGTDVVLLTSTFVLFRQTLVGKTRLAGAAVWDETTASAIFGMCSSEYDADVNTFLPFRYGYIARPIVTDAGDFEVSLVSGVGADCYDMSRSCWDLTAVAGERYHHLPHIRSTGAGSFVMAFPVVVDESLVTDITAGVDFMRMQSVGSAAMRSVTATSLRLHQGGFGMAYTDGVAHAELTPPPPIYVAVSGFDSLVNYGSSSPSGGGGSPAALLYVSFAFRWRDQKGNIHRSLPSNELTLAWWVLDSGDYYGVRWTFPRPFPMAIDGDRGGSYEVEVYQADTTGGTMYFLGVATPLAHPTELACDYIMPVAPAFSPMSQEKVDIVAVPSNVGLPTRWVDEGELQHIPPPPFVDVCSTQSRVWGLNGEKGRLEVWPSKLITEGYAPEFAPSIKVRIPAEGGECVALAALDDKVVVFKERAIFVIFGDPGNNNGERSTLQPPRLVSSDVGCSNPNSVVEGPFGVAFQASSESESARAGIHVIGRDLSISYVGGPAKELSAGVTFASGTLVPAEKEVRWCFPDGSGLLVWSYDVNRWHRHAGRAQKSSTLRRGRWCGLLLSGSDFFVETEKDTFGADDVHEMIITTSWLKLAGLQGFQRIWLAGHLFKHFTGGVTIEFAVDYNETFNPVDSRLWSTSALAALEPTSGDRAQVFVSPRIQKCEAIRFRITEDSANDGGRGLEYVGCVLEVGVKKGSFFKGSIVGARK